MEFYLGFNTSGNEIGFETYRNGSSSYVFIENILKNNAGRV